MTTRAQPGRKRLQLAAVVSLLLLPVALALMGTTALSASLSGRVGSPEVTLPLTERTLAEQPLVRIAVLGDVGTGESDEVAMARRVAALGATDPFDALVLLGDNVYPDGDPTRLGATVFGPFGPVLDAGAELLAVLGNHDAGYADEQVAALGMPGRWYQKTIGGVLFLGLDSTDAENPAQFRWLENTLAASSAEWVIAAMHHPPFSAGLHGSSEDTREAFVPLFEEYGVDLVLAGHDHDYQRSVPIGGVTYVVSGGGAKVRPTGSTDFTAVSAAVLHFVEVAVWADRMELTAISLGGTFDHAVLNGDAPALVSAASFPLGGALSDREATAGARLAGIGAIVSFLVVGAGWVTPRIAGRRVAGMLVVASTVSMLSTLAGIGMVTMSLVV